MGRFTNKNCFLFLIALAIFVCAAFLRTSRADATNPNLISFQGKVVNANGTNVTDGTYNFDFVLYDDVSLGTPSDGVHDKWHELSKSVTVTNGVFQTNLGSATALPNFNSNPTLYLAIKFNGDAAGYMSPRVQMTSVPYALNSDSLGGLGSSAFGQLAAASQTWTGTNTFQPTTNITSAIVKQTSSGSPTADIFNVQTANSTNILQVTGPAANEAAVTLKSVGATRDLTLDSASGTLKFGSATTTLQKSGTALTFDLNSASNSTLTVTNAGAGVASLSVEGGVTVGTDLAVNGNTTLGDATSDTVTFTGRVNSSILPSSNDAVDLGDDTHRWRDLYLAGDTVHLGTSISDETLLSYNTTSNSLVVKPASGNNSTSAVQIQNAVGEPNLIINTTSSSSTIGLTNTSFESGTTGWTNRTGCTLSNVTAQYLFGFYSGKCANTATANAGMNYNLTLSNSTQYTFSFYIKTTGTTGNVIDYGYSYNGSNETTYRSQNNYVGTSWSRVSYTFTPTGIAGTPYLFIKQNDATARDIFIDGVQIEAKSAPNPYAGAGTLQLPVIDRPLLVQPAQDGLAFEILAQNGGFNKLFIADTSSFSVGLAVNTGPTANARVQIGDPNTLDYISSALAVFGDARTLVAQASTGTTSVFVLQDSSGNSLWNVSNTGVTTLKNNSATGFSVQNSSANAVFSVDTSSSQVVLGQDSTLDGKLVFQQQAGSSNTITIQAPSLTVGSSYTLKLPYNGPSTSQCLQTDSGTASQLVFGSCGSGGGLAKNATDTSSASVTAGNYLYVFTNSGSTSGGVLSVANGANTGNALNVTSTGTSGTLIYAQNNNGSYSGNLIDLQSGSSPTTKFKVTQSGATTVASTLQVSGNVGINNSALANTLSINTPTNTFSGAQLVVNTGGTGNVGIVVEATSGQSTDLFQAVTNTGAVNWRISANGTVLGGAGSTTSTSSNTYKTGDVSAGTSQTSGILTLQSGDISGGTTSTSGAVTLQSGAATGSTNGSTGNITIDSGAKTGSGTAGSILIGTTNSPTITIGNTSSTTTIKSGTGNISLVASGGGVVGIGAASATTGLFTLYNSTNSNTVTLKAGTTIGSYTWTLPTADAAGCLQSNGSGTLSIATCGDTHIDVYSTAGSSSWTKPSNALLVIIDAIGGGGGGGGGGANTGGVVRMGGGGGGGGAHSRAEFTAANLGSSENYTVGAAGTSGTAGASGGSGGSGGTGGNTTFGTTQLIFAGGGGGGRLGANSAAAGSGGGGGGAGAAGNVGSTTAVAGGGPGLVSAGTANTSATGGLGGATSIAAGSPAAEWGGGGGGGHSATPANYAGGTSMYGGGGGGNGGGATVTPTVVAPSAGGASGTYALAGGSGGAAGTSGASPTAGTAGASGNSTKSGAGGGGGGSTVTANTAGAAGGAGGAPGGGGGGGGSGTNTGGGGAGGVGGAGELRVYTVRGSGADLAEVYCTNDASLQPGDAVAIDPALRAGVKKTQKAYDSNAIGTISTSPGLTTGGVDEQCVKPVLVALTGRVPLKVSLENGAIKPGDYITASSTPGVGMKATKAGQILGQALTGYDGSTPEYIVIFVEHSQSVGSTLTDLLGDQYNASSTLTLQQQALAYLAAWKDQAVERTDVSEIITDRVTAGIEIIAPSVIAQTVSTNTIKPSSAPNVSVELGEGGAFMIKKDGTDEVFSVDATGSTKVALNLVALGAVEARGGLRVDGDAIFNGESVFMKLAQFIGDVNIQGRVTFNSDVGGNAIIKKNTTKVHIAFQRDYEEKPIVSVNLTAEKSILADSTVEDIETKERRLFNEGYSYIISEITPKGFTIVLNKKANEELKFNWIATAVKDAQTAQEPDAVLPSQESE